MELVNEIMFGMLINVQILVMKWLSLNLSILIHMIEEYHQLDSDQILVILILLMVHLHIRYDSVINATIMYYNLREIMVILQSIDSHFSI